MDICHEEVIHQGYAPAQNHVQYSTVQRMMTYPVTQNVSTPYWSHLSFN